jgi:hypothetical protein
VEKGEGGEEGLSEAYSRKIRKAVHLLFYKRHLQPGVRGWELERELGGDYTKVLEVLDDYLRKLDLQVTTVFEGGEKPKKPTQDQLHAARYYITLRGEMDPGELKLVGWRIDDLAGLAVAIPYITAKGGKAPRDEVEAFLRVKIPGWRVDLNIERFIKYGYLGEDENGQLYLDWRTRAEVDQKTLIELLMSTKTPT